MKKDRYIAYVYVERPSENGVMSMHTHVPLKFAVKDKVLKFRDSEDDPWEDGWVVKKVGPPKLAKEFRKKASLGRDWKKKTDY